MFASSLFGIDLWGRVGRKWSQQHRSGLQPYLWNPWWRAFCYQGSQSGTAEMGRAVLTHEWRFAAPQTLGRVRQIEQTFESCWDTLGGAHTCSRTLDFWNSIQGWGLSDVTSSECRGIPHILPICLSTWTGFVSLVSPVILRTTWCLSTAPNRCNSIGGGGGRGGGLWLSIIEMCQPHCCSSPTQCYQCLRRPAPRIRPARPRFQLQGCSLPQIPPQEQPFLLPRTDVKRTILQKL